MTKKAYYWLERCTEVVYKGLRCIEASCVPQIDYVFVEAIYKSNTLMKFD